MVVKEIDLEKERKSGFRPVAVACIIHDAKILFAYQREFKIWQLPQGGIEPGETIKESLARELAEELGEFSDAVNLESLRVIGEDKVEFPDEQQGKRELLDSEGNQVHMKGKKYYFVLLTAGDKKLDIDDTEFEKYKWADAKKANDLIESIYQKGKKRITQKAIELVFGIET